jgi:DNA-binding CsgD family transcriptional regulator
VLLDVVDDQREGRSSSAAKKADADRKIAFARRSSRLSRSNCMIFSASLVLVPGRSPASTSACVTQPRSVSALIPNCSPIRTHALGRLAGSLRASNVNLIARSRSSSGYFRGAAILDPPWLDGPHQTRHETSFSAGDLAEALRRRLNPTGPHLTPREAEVLQLLAEGLAVSGLAKALFISESTTKTHIARLYEKLGASNRTQALMSALRLGLLHHPRGAKPQP